MVLSSLVSAGEVASLPEINLLLLFAEPLIEKAVSVSEAGTHQRGEKEIEREQDVFQRADETEAELAVRGVKGATLSEES